MEVESFEKGIRHLTQKQLLTAGQSALNKLLVEKGVVTVEELQNGLTEWMQEHGKEAPKRKAKKKKK